MSKMKALMLIFAAVATGFTLHAQSADWLWALNPGGSVHEFGQGVATDAAGNTYVTGGFSQSISFGATTLISAGNYDVFVAKLDPDQNWLWAVKAGGTGDDGGDGIGVDSSGNVYVCGSYHDQAFFGSIQLTGLGIYDAFVAKLDTDGNWMWASSAVSPGYDIARAIAVNDTGNCYVSGCFQELAVFGSLSLVSAGETDAFVGKLDPNGNWLWVSRAGGTENDQSYGLDLDASGNVLVCGNFRQTADFGTFELTSLGGYDIFAAKLDGSGNWLWAVRAGGPDTSDFIPDIARGIAADAAGNVLFTGTFLGFGNFGPTNLVSGGNLNADLYVAKLDNAGNWLWASQGTGTSTDVGYCIATDQFGNAWLSGCFYETLSFFGVGSITSSGSTDIFLAGIDAAGEWFCARRAGGVHIDCGSGICCTAAGNLLLIGHFMATADFGDFSLTSFTGQDVFVAKFGSQTPVSDEHNGTAAPFANLKAGPNPLRNEATFEIELRDGLSNCELSIFDLRGRKIATLHQGSLARGRHTLCWNCSPGLPAGVYLYRLSIRERSLNGRLIKL